MVRHLDIRTFWQRDGRCSSSQRRLTPGPGAWARRRSSLYIYIEVSAVTSTQHACAFFLVVERNSPT